MTLFTLFDLFSLNFVSFFPTALPTTGIDPVTGHHSQCGDVSPNMLHGCINYSNIVNFVTTGE